MKRSTLIGWPLGLLVVYACARPTPVVQGPDEAYSSFARLAQRDPRSAYEMLSKRTRELLSARAKELSGAADGSIVDDPIELFFSRPERPAPLGDVKVLKAEGDRAVLEVTAGGKAGQVEMVKEDSKWSVDLYEQAAAAAEGRAR